MKRVKKNQVIITALAIMIAVAGYINYAGNISDIISNVELCVNHFLTKIILFPEQKIKKYLLFKQAD